jgi:hypothetical protein
MVVVGGSEKRLWPKPYPREKLGRGVGNRENEERAETERDERKKGLVFENALPEGNGRILESSVYVFD